MDVGLLTLMLTFTSDFASPREHSGFGFQCLLKVDTCKDDNNKRRECYDNRRNEKNCNGCELIILLLLFLRLGEHLLFLTDGCVLVPLSYLAFRQDFCWPDNHTSHNGS